MANRRKESVVLWFGISLIITTGTLSAEQHASSEAMDIHTQQAAVEPVQLQNQAGLRAFIDPRTGEFVSVPPAKTEMLMDLAPEEKNNLSRSHEGLEAVIQPDGSLKVDLKGRFRSTIFATVNASGEISTTHDAKRADFSDSSMMQSVSGPQGE